MQENWIIISLSKIRFFRYKKIMENFWKSSLEPSNFVQITLQKDFQCAQIEDHAPLRGEILKTILFILKSSFPRTITFGESSFGWINQMNNQALEQEVGKIVKKKIICNFGKSVFQDGPFDQFQTILAQSMIG